MVSSLAAESRHCVSMQYIGGIIYNNIECTSQARKQVRNVLSWNCRTCMTIATPPTRFLVVTCQGSYVNCSQVHKWHTFEAFWQIIVYYISAVKVYNMVLKGKIFTYRTSPLSIPKPNAMVATTLEKEGLQYRVAQVVHWVFKRTTSTGPASLAIPSVQLFNVFWSFSDLMDTNSKTGHRALWRLTAHLYDMVEHSTRFFADSPIIHCKSVAVDSI